MTAFNTALNARMTQMEENFSKQLKSISFAASEKHPSIKKIESLLEENEFTFSYINEITEKLQSNFTLDALDDFKAVERKVVDWIGKTISIAPEKIQRPPHVVVIVGPTGVGKTTTLVKLATKMVSEAKREERRIPSFAFITTDTMRVGAYEQLASYSTIFETELEKAETVEDLKKLYDEKRENLDAIFIDTSGYSPNDTENIGKMKAVLDVRGMKPDIHLAVAASTKATDLANIMQNYEQFGYNSVIVTKCDESKQYGNVISVLHEKNKKISYIADGQKVVRDIHRADVVQFLIRLSGFDVDRVHIEDEFGE
ncbi:flagellar biosynthesis protein FlhF, partial [Treponema socranskii]